MKDCGLPEYDASIITMTPESLAFFDGCVKSYSDAKTISNWIMGDLTRLLNQNNIEITDCKITPDSLVSMLKMIDDGKISGKMAKDIFEDMFNTGKNPEVIVKEKGMVQISDEQTLVPILEDIIANNPRAVEDYKSGKKKAMGAMVGQVMKATKGQANPALVNKLLQQLLGR